MRLMTSTKRGNGTNAPPSTGSETAPPDKPPVAAPILSPARRRLAAALNASVVVDAKRIRIEEAIQEAERTELVARETLDDLRAGDRRAVTQWLAIEDETPKPAPRTAAIKEATGQLEEASRALADLRLALAEHDRSMAPTLAEARRNAEAVPAIALEVIAEEAAKLIEEWKPLLYQTARIHVCLESFRAAAYQKSDLGMLRVAEGIMHAMDVAARGFPRSVRPGLPPDVSDPRSLAAQRAWWGAIQALQSNPAIDVVEMIKAST